MKKYRYFFVVVLLFAVTRIMAYDFKTNGIYYNIIENDEVEVTYKEYVEGQGGTSDYSGDIVIPDYVWDGPNWRCVVRIGKDAFKGSDVSSVTLGPNIWMVGDSAFKDCTRLHNVSLAEGWVREMGGYVFNGCTNLKRLAIPSTVVKIGRHPFGNSGIKTLIFEDSNEELLFAGEDYIPLDTLYHGRQKTRWESSPYFRGDDHMHFYGDYLIIGDSVNSIYCSTLSTCSVKNRSFPKTVKIGKNFTSFGGDAFRTSSIDTTDVFISNMEQWCSLAKGNLRNKRKRLHIDDKLISTAVIPGSVKEIAYDFRECVNIKAVVMEDGVEIIGSGTFEGCRGLHSLSIPSTVNSIDISAFSYCDSICSITIADNSPHYSCIGTTIYDKEKTKVVFDLGKPTKVEIPANVTEIGQWGFSKCASSLTEMYLCNPTPCTIYENTFKEAQYEKVTLYVPYGSAQLYRAAEIWQNFTNIVEFDASPIADITTTAAPEIHSTAVGITVGNYSGTIAVYSLDGTLYRQIITTGAPTTIPLPNGTFIIKAGEIISKITR